MMLIMLKAIEQGFYMLGNYKLARTFIVFL